MKELFKKIIIAILKSSIGFIIIFGLNNKKDKIQYSEIDDSWGSSERCEPIDYVALKEDGHKILSENICINSMSIYEDDWLMEQLEFELSTEKEGIEKYNMRKSVIDYFLFDLNDDGINEYIVSFSGSLWNGSAGNTVFILKKNEEGASEKIIHVVGQVYGYENGYWPIAVLDEKSDDYYKIIFPWTDNKIWEYDVEKKQYEIGIPNN